MPNMVTPILFGVLLKNRGTKLIFCVFFICISGHVIFCIGIFTGNYFLMTLGRAINGSGSEGINISLNYLVKLYVPQEHILKINSLSMVISRIAYATTYYLNPKIAIATESLNYNMLISF